MLIVVSFVGWASILTPLPGTPLFEKMRSRIVDFDWEHYDYGWAVYEPAQMSRADAMASRVVCRVVTVSSGRGWLADRAPPGDPGGGRACAPALFLTKFF